jgi:NAD(P)-dependent dehydrogenase (short-subunit alcohol dehydrogenase family)
VHKPPLDLSRAETVAAQVGDSRGAARAIVPDVTAAGAAEAVVNEAVAAFGRIGILVNSAGGSIASLSSRHTTRSG